MILVNLIIDGLRKLDDRTKQTFCDLNLEHNIDSYEGNCVSICVENEIGTIPNPLR